MSALYLYAVASAELACAPPEVGRVEAAGLRAWFGEDPEGGAETAFALTAAGGCLPARRAPALAGGRPELTRWLEAAAPRLRPALERVSGCVEFVVDVAAGAPVRRATAVEADAPSAHGYLRAAAARARAARAAGARFDEALDNLETRLRAAWPGAELRRRELDAERAMISLLAPLAARGAVVEALRAASHAPETAALRARGSGPWPPYSFADFAEEAAA